MDNLKYVLLEFILINVVKYYAVRGFCVVMITVDIQFKSLKDQNRVGVKFNIVSKDEYAPIIESIYRVIEEHYRCYFTMIPFDYMPRQMVVQLIKLVVFYVNAFV